MRRRPGRRRDRVAKSGSSRNGPEDVGAEGEPRVVLSRRGLRRWRGGHPWIFRDDLEPRGPVANGDVVLVVSERGEAVG